MGARAGQHCWRELALNRLRPDHLVDVKVRQTSMIASEDRGRCADDVIGNTHGGFFFKIFFTYLEITSHFDASEKSSSS